MGRAKKYVFTLAIQGEAADEAQALEQALGALASRILGPNPPSLRDEFYDPFLSRLPLIDAQEG